MGIFTGIKGMKAVRKIKKGDKAKISLAMVSMMIINLPDAKAKLEPEVYKKIEDLFMQFQKCSTLYEVDMDGYVRLCEDVIRKFDKIAPYYLYSGGNELEASIYMDDLHSRDEEKKKSIKDTMIDSYEIDEEYVKHLQSHHPLVTDAAARDFYKVLVAYALFGKKEALNRFNQFAQDMIDSDLQYAMLTIGYFCGVLEPNGIVTSDECDELSDKYMKKINELVIKNRGNI